MESDELTKIISQIIKYNLQKAFDVPTVFDKRLKELNQKQIKNFISLEIDPNKIKFPTYLLLNQDLLNCDDYIKRVEAMNKIIPTYNDSYLLKILCSPDFLNSKYYYEDMEMLSEVFVLDPLWIIENKDFINSKYHKEDLRLIVDTVKNKKSSKLLVEALCEVATNADSINSRYHLEDMKLISSSSSDCLQPMCSYPHSSLNNLATNKVSLKDVFHIENMKILSTNPIAKELLYKIMTDKDKIKGKYYRSETYALVYAKSIIKANAIYNYISSPSSLSNVDYSNLLYNYSDIDFKDIWVINNENRKNNSDNPNYLKYLKLLSVVDDRFVFFVESLLSNSAFSNSVYCNNDIELLLSIKDKDLFIDLYKVISNEVSLNGSHHLDDLDYIINVGDKRIRNMLIDVATDKTSVNSPNHDFDMNYIYRLDLDSIDKERLSLIKTYIFTEGGINHPYHCQRLDKLLKGEMINSEDVINEHLDHLKNNSNNESNNREYKPFARIRQMLKRK